MTDPSEWTLPDPKAVIAAMDSRSERATRENWVFSDQISSVDLYSYLKHRFGEAGDAGFDVREQFTSWFQYTQRLTRPAAQHAAEADGRGLRPTDRRS